MFGGMTKTGGFEVCPNMGENRRKNETKKSSRFTWVIFQIEEKMVPCQWFPRTNLYHNLKEIKTPEYFSFEKCQIC